MCTCVRGGGGVGLSVSSVVFVCVTVEKVWGTGCVDMGEVCGCDGVGACACEGCVRGRAGRRGEAGGRGVARHIGGMS